jgi:hypothetical protein
MVNVSEIGSLCDITIQGKYPLFTETHFDQILIKDNYERQIDTQNNNQTYYRKGDVIIFTNFQQNTITLRLFNTISLQTKYGEFSTLLAKLSFKPEHISIMGGNFKTFVTGIGTPQVLLNKFFNEKAQTKLSDKLRIKASILSVVVANADASDVDLQVRIEPLNSSPLDSLYVEFIFRTIKDLVENISEIK